ncbi:hypothetical protein HAX54_026876, partial [Datura stramonium]|nr:hypothetical protein [Datura stramonium]
MEDVIEPQLMIKEWSTKNKFNSLNNEEDAINKTEVDATNTSMDEKGIEKKAISEYQIQQEAITRAIAPQVSSEKEQRRKAKHPGSEKGENRAGKQVIEATESSQVCCFNCPKSEITKKKVSNGGVEDTNLEEGEANTNNMAIVLVPTIVQTDETQMIEELEVSKAIEWEDKGDPLSEEAEVSLGAKTVKSTKKGKKQGSEDTTQVIRVQPKKK